MKKRLIITCAIALLFLIIINGSSSSFAGAEEDIKAESAASVLKEIMIIPEKSVPGFLFKDAHAVAVIPEVIKAGFMVGGSYGEGLISVKQKDGSWSLPCFLTIKAGSIGFQIGVQSTDVVLVFKSEKSLNNLIKGKFTLGADAAVAAGPLGRQAQAGTDIELKAEIFSYSRSRGVFAGISLEGAALEIDHDANQKFYNKTGVRPELIFDGSIKEAPKAASAFTKTLMTYTKK